MNWRDPGQALSWGSPRGHVGPQAPAMELPRVGRAAVCRSLLSPAFQAVRSDPRLLLLWVLVPGQLGPRQDEGTGWGKTAPALWGAEGALGRRASPPSR